MDLLREKCQTASPVGWDFVDDLSTTRSTFPTVPFKSLADDDLSLNLNYSTFHFLHNWLVDFEGFPVARLLLQVVNRALAYIEPSSLRRR